MRNVLLISLFLALTIPLAAQDVSISAETTAMVNLRTGPGLEYVVIAILPYESVVAATGRNGNWIQVRIDGDQGWVYGRYLRVQGGVDRLPEVVAPQEPESETVEPIVPLPSNDTPRGVVSGTGSNVRQIFQRGQQLGNRADVFAKVGDSITASGDFLRPIADGGLILGSYAYLQTVVEYFSQTTARDHNSFGSSSVAARAAWTTADVLNPSLAAPGLCQVGVETPLECEYRLIQPAVALIMFGTNDVHLLDLNTYEANLRRIVEISVDRGVIPVLSTIPEQPARVGLVAPVNAIIRRVASVYRVPVWHYYEATQGLPNYGISVDNIHPSVNPLAPGSAAVFTPDNLGYGYNVRNLTALQVLDAIWRQVLR
jgi:hypothetical protein